MTLPCINITAKAQYDNNGAQEIAKAVSQRNLLSRRPSITAFTAITNTHDYAQSPRTVDVHIHHLP